MTHTYGTSTSEFPVGTRVEIHPVSDLWMAGARFGNVTHANRDFVYVQLDNLAPNTPAVFAPMMLRVIEGQH